MSVNRFLTLPILQLEAISTYVAPFLPWERKYLRMRSYWVVLLMLFQYLEKKIPGNGGSPAKKPPVNPR